MRKSIAIVPVREFEDTKLRLKTILAPKQRGELTKKLLQGVLAGIEASRVSRVIVVATDPTLVRGMPSAFQKMQVIRESILHGGVNSAMRDGLSVISDQGYESVLLMPSDLPLITAEALNKVLQLLDSYDLLINAACKLDGTSLLAFNLSKPPIPLHYDDDSFRQHVEEARKQGFHFRVLDMIEFSHDVDSTEDIESLMKRTRAESFEDMLARLGK